MYSFLRLPIHNKKRRRAMKVLIKEIKEQARRKRRIKRRKRRSKPKLLGLKARRWTNVYNCFKGIQGIYVCRYLKKRMRIHRIRFGLPLPVILWSTMLCLARVAERCSRSLLSRKRILSFRRCISTCKVCLPSSKASHRSKSILFKF